PWAGRYRQKRWPPAGPSEGRKKACVFTAGGKSRRALRPAPESSGSGRAAELAADEVGEGTDRREGFAVDVAVVDEDAELLFEGGDERHHGHRVELGNGAEEVGLAGEGGATSVEAQYFIEHSNDF